MAERTGMKNRLTDLNDNLFEQMERLLDAETEDELNTEIARSRALSQVAAAITDNARLAFDIAKAMAVQNGGELNVPAMIEGRG